MFLFLYGSEWQDLSGYLCNQCFCFFWSVASFRLLGPGCCFLTHTGYMRHYDKPAVPLGVLEIIPCLWHSMKIFTFWGVGDGNRGRKNILLRLGDTFEVKVPRVGNCTASCCRGSSSHLCEGVVWCEGSAGAFSVFSMADETAALSRLLWCLLLLCVL